jgi:low affinity Fe/Cu permease
MSSQAQIAANQSNAQLSTGPTSDAGKAVSSQNNFRHGFTGAFRVVNGEKQEEFDTLLGGLRAEHEPATITETLLVEKMAQSWWLRTRALLLQNTCFVDDSVGQKQLALYLRYQTANERAFHKALNELLKLRAGKRKAEIGFESQQSKQNRAREQAEFRQNRARQQAEEHARKQAAEKRRQELHKWNVLRAEAEVDHRVLLNLNLQTPEHPVSVGPQRIIDAQKAA